MISILSLNRNVIVGLCSIFFNNPTSSLCLPERPLIDFGDASMMMGFLAAQGSGHKSCLYRAACEYPDSAMQYAQAGHATLTGVEIFNRWVKKTAKALLHTSTNVYSLFYRSQSVCRSSVRGLVEWNRKGGQGRNPKCAMQSSLSVPAVDRDRLAAIKLSL